MFISRKAERRIGTPPASGQPYSAEVGAGLKCRVNRDRRQIDPLEFIRLFSGVPSHLAYELMERCTILEFNSSDQVLSPEQENDSLLILLSGILKVYLEHKTSNGFIINPGECVGEMSIIDGKPVSAYVIAETACRMLAIHQNVFWTSLSQIPDLARNLLAAQAERMRIRDQAVLQRLQAQMELDYI